MSAVSASFCRHALSRSGRLTRPSALAPAASCIANQRRHLNLHEYQAWGIFKDFGVSVPKSTPAFSVKEVDELSKEFGAEVVIKSQVMTGGRGLGHFKESGLQGGVHLTSTDKVVGLAEKMLGNTLVTKQTGETGLPVHTVMLCERFQIKNEKYFAILMDRGSGGPLLVGSKVGGTSIEDIAAEDPTAILKMPIDIMDGISEAEASDFASKMGFTGDQVKAAASNIMGLYKVFIECDCTQIEINPLAELTDGRVIVCDAKVEFDDNASFRQKDIFAKRDTSQENPLEVEAKECDLNYIKLDGSVAIMVNGAGLAMATMDLVNQCGGTPANFLDVGGAANRQTCKAAFKLLQTDPNVKVLFVNIFGGIMKCDVIADGVVGAVQEMGLKLPLVVRLEGTNVEQGKKIINESGLPVYFYDDFTTAAKKAVEISKAPRHASLGIVRLDYDYPASPGDIDHPDSFSYDVFYRAVPGLTFEMCQQGVMPEDVKAEFLDAVKFLIDVKGVSAITGDCGFMMYFQKLARTITTHEPVFMSALVSLPAVTCAYAHDELIGIFTANGESLEPMHDLIKDECGVDTHEHRYIIVGCEDIPGFEAVALGTKVDYDKVEPGVVKRALETQAAHPTMRAILFECTELPQFSDAVRHATGLPVYDAITTCNLFMEGLRDNERFGKNNWHAKWDGEQEEYKFGAELTKEQQAKLVNKPAASTFFTPVEAIGA
mmetsp:Transcript_80105/g.146410  ORF Transcript_80105/g.146410 Transcript_80105/m.146410 type:complete len:716 (-) Transcript_80105:101-2248(-)